MKVAFQSVAVIGAGAIGMYYGVRLARAGAEVKFLLRGDLAAVRAGGVMRIREPETTLELRAPLVFGSVAEIGPVDLVLVTLKTTANAALAELLPPLLKTDTAVLTLQNGLGADEQIAAQVGADRVLSGLAFIACMRSGPGEVACFHPGSIAIGEFGRAATERARALGEQFVAAGVKVRVVDDVQAARWRKLVWNIPFNGLTIAAGGIPTDRICADAALADRVRRLMVEVQRGAAAFGFTISDEFLRQQFEVTPPMGPYRPSSLVDFLAGREVEIEAIWGEPLRRARAAGVELPELARLYDELRGATLRSARG